MGVDRETSAVTVIGRYCGSGRPAALILGYRRLVCPADHVPERFAATNKNCRVCADRGGPADNNGGTKSCTESVEAVIHCGKS